MDKENSKNMVTHINHLAPYTDIQIAALRQSLAVQVKNGFFNNPMQAKDIKFLMESMDLDISRRCLHQNLTMEEFLSKYCPIIPRVGFAPGPIGHLMPLDEVQILCPDPNL